MARVLQTVGMGLASAEPQPEDTMTSTIPIVFAMILILYRPLYLLNLFFVLLQDLNRETKGHTERELTVYSQCSHAPYSKDNSSFLSWTTDSTT